jgi:flagellar FliL protein
MSDQTLEHEGADLEKSSSRKAGGMFSIVKAIAFVALIVIVEVVAAAMLVPSAQETERLAQQLAAASTGKTTSIEDEHHADEEESHHDQHEIREVELGSYNITRFNPTTNTTLAIDFELYGTVLEDEAGEFLHLFENNKARIREQVTMTLHSAESADLTDAGLGLIKRQILEKTNRALGQPFLKELLFSKFSFVER